MPWSRGRGPFGEQQALQGGQAVKGGLVFDPGVSQETADELHRLRRQSGGWDLAAGQQYGNGKYVITAGDVRQNGWSRYSPGDDYERISYDLGINGVATAPKNGGQLNNSFDRSPYIVWSRKPEPAPAETGPDPADPEPPATPKPSSPSVYAAAPSLADALAGQEEKERRRDGASRPGLQAVLDSALRINRREPADWRDAGSGRAADGASGGEDDRDRPGRRFAASSHWRSQLDAVRRRLDEDQAFGFA